MGLRHFEGLAAGAFGSPLSPAAATRVERFDARNRIVRIGPLFQVTYVTWLVYGGVFGAIAGGYIDGDWSKGMRDVGYNDNPWEYWAYQHGGDDSKAGKLAY